MTTAEALKLVREMAEVRVWVNINATDTHVTITKSEARRLLHCFDPNTNLDILIRWYPSKFAEYQDTTTTETIRYPYMIIGTL